MSARCRKPGLGAGPSPVLSTASILVTPEPERASHPAMLAFVSGEAAFIEDVSGGAIARLVLLAGLDARLRGDRAFVAEVEAAAPEAGTRLLRAALRAAAGQRRIELDRVTRLEILHRVLYDLGVDRSGSGRSDAERDSARAKYAGLYGRMVVAVAEAVIDGRLTRQALLEAVIHQRWPAGLPYGPWREGDHDLIDEVRPGHVQLSIDEQLLALDRDDGRPDMRVVARLATSRDVADELIAREELGGAVGVVMAEYAAFKEDVSNAARQQTRLLLTLLLHGWDSAAVTDGLVAEGFARVEANTVDVAWKRALKSYETLPDVLSRRRGDFADVVWTLERLAHVGSCTTGRLSTTVR
jgi:hypothetical protein